MSRWLTAALCALLLAPAALACRSNDAPAAQDDPVSEQADAGLDGAADSADADRAENADAAAGADDAGDESAADAGAEEAPVDEPTPDPTIVALAQSFTPHVKGDPNAPVMIYEFSDYL